MTDRQLEAFIKAAECGSFTKAAALLFITPSALMQQVNLFEKEAGFPLFYRTSHGVKLTPGGAVSMKRPGKSLRNTGKPALTAGNF